MGKKDDVLKLLLADDHHVFRNGINVLLHDKTSFNVIGEAANGRDLMKKLEKEQPDVLLLDINMPDMSGLDVMPMIKERYPDLKVLVFSMHDDADYIKDMLQSGAKGYVLKSVRKDELKRAIRTVAVGDTYLSKEVSAKLVANLSASDSAGGQVLTSREVEVLKLVAQGLTNKKIGDKLFISPRTVDTHRRNMMEKLDLHSAAALTQYAAQQGLLD